MSTKRKLPHKLGQPVVRQGAKPIAKGSLNESKTVVTGGGHALRRSTNGDKQVVSISSDSPSSDEEEEEEAEDSDDVADDVGSASGDVAMEDAVLGDATNGRAEADGEPSFGDLVRANASEPIDVAGAFEDAANQALAFPKQIQPPSGASLGTVLTQALRTNDISLLESCLHTTDVATIRATIQRLDSPLAGVLLQKLAERLHRRPGRAGSLMVWVQWTLVTHGGYLATQRDLIKKLAGLNRVIDERAKGLQSLLSLKGKLDMLEAQIELRRSMQSQRRQLEDEDNDDDVIYVEGEESDNDDDEGGARAKRLDFDDEDSEESEDMPGVNGVIADSEDSDEEDDSDDDEGDDLLDMEAEETDADTGDEDEVDHDDQDSNGEDDESDDGAAAPPPKLQRVSGMSSRKR